MGGGGGEEGVREEAAGLACGREPMWLPSCMQPRRPNEIFDVFKKKSISR